QRCGKRTADHVGCAARRKRIDQRDRARRIDLLGLARSGTDRCGGRSRSDHELPSVHLNLPEIAVVFRWGWSPTARTGSTARAGRCGRRLRLIEDGDGAGPTGRGRVNLHREATDREALGGKLFEIVQFLDVAVADLAAGAVAFP